MTHRYHKDNIIRRIRRRRKRRTHEAGGQRLTDILLLVFVFLALVLFGVIVIGVWG